MISYPPANQLNCVDPQRTLSCACIPQCCSVYQPIISMPISSYLGNWEYWLKTLTPLSCYRLYDFRPCFSIYPVFGPLQGMLCSGQVLLLLLRDWWLVPTSLRCSIPIWSDTCSRCHWHHSCQFLGASRSAWEDVEWKLTKINVRRVSDPRWAIRLNIGVAIIPDDRYRSTMEIIVIRLEPHWNAREIIGPVEMYWFLEAYFLKYRQICAHM